MFKQDCLSIEGRLFTSRIGIHGFCSRDLDLDPMTLIRKLDLDIPHMYLQTKNEFSRSRLSEVQTSEHYRQTDATENLPANWRVILIFAKRNSSCS